MKYPNFSFEKKLWKKGLKVIAGVDEVGRGCFAGPVVAGCAVFSPDTRYEIPDTILIDDSKKLRPRQRERAEKWIKQNALSWGVGETNTALINRIGMARASRVAFREAIKAVNLKLKIKNLKLDFLLIDAFYIPYVKGIQMPRKNARKNHASRDSRARQKAIIDGDQKSISIAAASIVAKVYRDKIMQRLSREPKYKIYRWGRNKGYGTKEHQMAIRKYGLTRYHRTKFVETFLNNYS